MSIEASRTARLKLGDTEVARVGLGTNRLTTAHVDFVKEAVRAGVEHIDTAHVYTGGESERAIGQALSPAPEGCVVATKGGYAGRGSREELRAQIEESFRRLRTDHIALYYLHRVDPETPLEASLGAIKEYVDARRIGQVGVSAVGTEEIERARRVVPIAAVQNHYNLSQREHEDVVDYCAEEGIAFVPYYPLQGDEAPVLVEIAKRHDATPAQVALAWLLHRSPAMLPIPGTLSLDHLKESLGALEIELSDAEFEAMG